jgi:hypothetical protein
MQGNWGAGAAAAPSPRRGGMPRGAAGGGAGAAKPLVAAVWSSFGGGPAAKTEEAAQLGEDPAAAGALHSRGLGHGLGLEVPVGDLAGREGAAVGPRRASGSAGARVGMCPQARSRGAPGRTSKACSPVRQQSRQARAWRSCTAVKQQPGGQTLGWAIQNLSANTTPPPHR